MAAHIRRKLWHLSEKQRIVNRIVASSDCWTSINDLRPKFTALSARDNLRHKKARRQTDLNINISKENYNMNLLTNEQFKVAKDIEMQKAKEEYRGYDLYIVYDINNNMSTVGNSNCDYTTFQDFIIYQLIVINNIKKFAQKIGYCDGQEMLQDFFENNDNDEFWQGIAEDSFDLEYMGDN